MRAGRSARPWPRDQADLPAARAEAAQAELVSSNNAWGAKFPTVVAALGRDWERVIPFFAFPRRFAT